MKAVVYKSLKGINNYVPQEFPLKMYNDSGKEDESKVSF